MQGETLALWRRAERARLRAARAALTTEERARAECAIGAQVVALLESLGRRCVALYWPIDHEPDLRPLAPRLRAGGWSVALPALRAPCSPLDFRLWHEGAPLEPARFGLRQPAPEAPCTVPDIVLLPALGWDRAGYRLGYGAGYFDRTLAVLAPRPLAVGVALEAARLETVHPQPWDQPLDWLVTERGAYRREGAALAFVGTLEQGTGRI